MPTPKKAIPAHNALEKISYFLSCYKDLQLSSYDNANLDAFQLLEADVLWYKDCLSTNDVLKEYSQHKVEVPPMVCIAETQSAGRGQHGREWLSGEGNLHMSMLLPTRNLFELDGKLALEIAMSLMDVSFISALKMKSQFRVGIKWPNDMCVSVEDSRTNRTEIIKFGGILIEPIKDSMGTLTAIVVGVGLNVNNTKLDKADGKQIASLSALLGNEVDLPLLAAQVCYACQHAINRFTRGSSGMFARFFMHDLLYEHNIEVEQANNQTITGVASGVDADGSLKVLINESEKPETVNIYDGRVRIV